MADKLNTYPQKPSITLDYKDLKDQTGTGWGTCIWCGGENKSVELKFKDVVTLPLVDEVLTGGTSGDTGTVTEIETITVSTGYIHMKPYTGVGDDDNFCFEDGETVTGSLGASFTADGAGSVKNYSIYWPKHEMTFYEGKWYCNKHFKMVHGGLKQRDKSTVYIDERRDEQWR